MIRYTFYAFIIVIYLSPLHIHADVSFTKQNVPTVTPNTNHLNSSPQHEDISRKAAKAMAEAESAVRESETVIRETKLAEEAASTATTQQETARDALLKTESAIQLGHILDAKAEAHKTVEAADAAKTAASMAEESVSKVKTAVENVQRHQKAAEQAAHEAREAIKKVKEAKEKATKKQITPTQSEEQKGVTPIEKTVESVPLDPKKKVEENTEVESPAESQEKGKDGDNVEKDASSETMTPVVQVVPPETVENTTSEEGVGTPHTTDSDRNTKTPPVDPPVKNLESKTQQPIETDKVKEQNNASETRDTERIAPSQPEKGNPEEPIQKPVNVPIVTETGKTSSASGNTGTVLPEKKDNENETNVNPLPEKQKTEEPKEEKLVTPDVPSTPLQEGQTETESVPKKVEEKVQVSTEGAEDGIKEGEAEKEGDDTDGAKVGKKEADGKEEQKEERDSQQVIADGDVEKVQKDGKTPTSSIVDEDKPTLNPTSVSGDVQEDSVDIKTGKDGEGSKSEEPHSKLKTGVEAVPSKPDDPKINPDSTGTDLSAQAPKAKVNEQQQKDITVVNVKAIDENTQTESSPGNEGTQDAVEGSDQQPLSVTSEQKSAEQSKDGGGTEQLKSSQVSKDSHTQEIQQQVKSEGESHDTEGAQKEHQEGKEKDQSLPQGSATSDQNLNKGKEAQDVTTQQSSDEGEGKSAQSAKTVGGVGTAGTTQPDQTALTTVHTATVNELTSDGVTLSSASFHESLTRMKRHASALSASFTSQTESQSPTTSNYDSIEEKLNEAMKKANEVLNNSEKSLNEALKSLLSATEDAKSADEMAKKAAKAIEGVNEKDFAFTYTNTITALFCGLILLLTMTTT